MATPSSGEVELRDVRESDLPTFFEHQRDPKANRMAAFIGRDPTDREAFAAHWVRLLRDDTVVVKAVLFEGRLAGHVAKWELEGKPQVTYWIGSEHWGKGVATLALAEFLRQFTRRPLYASAAKDNVASLRVLEKCGFTVIGSQRAFANARGEEIDEVLLELRTAVAGGTR